MDFHQYNSFSFKYFDKTKCHMHAITKSFEIVSARMTYPGHLAAAPLLPRAGPGWLVISALAVHPCSGIFVSQTLANLRTLN